MHDGAAVYSPGSERRSGASRFRHTDALGSTRGITDAGQTATDAWLHDAFGVTVIRTGTTPTPFGFAGGHEYQSDGDSGLMLLGNRYYDPSIGRFISSDPVQAGTNWYAYCGNNPLGSVDPAGLWKLSFGVGAVGVLAPFAGWVDGEVIIDPGSLRDLVTPWDWRIGFGGHIGIGGGGGLYGSVGGGWGIDLGAGRLHTGRDNGIAAGTGVAFRAISAGINFTFPSADDMSQPSGAGGAIPLPLPGRLHEGVGYGIGVWVGPQVGGIVDLGSPREWWHGLDELLKPQPPPM